MSLHFAVNIVIVNFFQVIGKPLVFDCQQPEEGGLSCALSTNKAEHNLKFASRFEHPTDCSQHKQLQALIGAFAVLCAEIVGEGIANTLCAVPCQAVQIVTDGVVFVAVSDNGDCLLDFLFAGQRVLIFQIEHQVI